MLEAPTSFRTASIAAVLVCSTMAQVSTAGHEWAQAQSVGEPALANNLRFVGAVEAGNFEDVFSANDIALFVAAVEPVTLNDMIRLGVPVRTARIQQFIRWGLMRQEGNQFVSVIPVLSGSRAAEFSAAIDSALDGIANETAAALVRIQEHIQPPPGVAALPVLTAWILQERVWHHLARSDGVDFRTFIADQRASVPDRGFWGALWYDATPVPSPYRFYEVRRGDYTIQIAWNRGEDADPFGDMSAGSARVQEFLSKLRDDGRRVNDPEDFPEASRTGLIGADRRVQAYATEYRMDRRASLSGLVEEVAVAIAETVLRRLPLRELRASLRSAAPQVVYAAAYTELMPKLVRELADRGLPVVAGSVPVMTDPRGGTEAAVPPARATLSRPATVDGRPDRIAPPRYSAVIWKKMPVRGGFRLPW